MLIGWPGGWSSSQAGFCPCTPGGPNTAGRQRRQATGAAAVLDSRGATQPQQRQGRTGRSTTNKLACSTSSGQPMRRVRARMRAGTHPNPTPTHLFCTTPGWPYRAHPGRGDAWGVGQSPIQGGWTHPGHRGAPAWGDWWVRGGSGGSTLWCFSFPTLPRPPTPPMSRVSCATEWDPQRTPWHSLATGRPLEAG